MRAIAKGIHSLGLLHFCGRFEGVLFAHSKIVRLGRIRNDNGLYAKQLKSRTRTRTRNNFSDTTARSTTEPPTPTPTTAQPACRLHVCTPPPTPAPFQQRNTTNNNNNNETTTTTSPNTLVTLPRHQQHYLNNKITITSKTWHSIVQAGGDTCIASAQHNLYSTT